MLSERQLEAMLKVYQDRMQEVTAHHLTRMGEHLRSMGRLSASDINRLVEMKRVNINMEKAKREIANAARISIQDVEEAFAAAAESDSRFAMQVFASDHTPAIKANPALERILKAQAKITQQALANLSQTTLLSEGYKNAVDVAVQTVQAGISDYNSAIRRAMKAAALEGLRVQYPNSATTRRLDSAIRMNILDGIRAMNQDIMRQVGKEFGADGVEIDAHALCAEDHLPYQGTQMSNRDFEHLQNTILDRPFGIWNCRHSWFPIIMGITPPTYTQEELDDFKTVSREEITIDGRTKSRYEWTQEQRRIETAIRYQKDIAIMAKASGDMVARRECAAMIRELEKQYSKITEAAGLDERRDKMRVAGFNAVKPADELKHPEKYGIITDEEKRIKETLAIIRSDKISKTINPEKQARHIKTSSQYDGKRSYIFGNEEDAQQLVNQYHGTGTPVFDRKGNWKNKEIATAKDNIGVNISADGKEATETNRFVIHYSKTGTHIVPTSRGERNDQ